MKVHVSFRRGTFFLSSLGVSYPVFGLYEGDTCDDLRAEIKVATNNGSLARVPVVVSGADLVRWIDSSAACWEHYHVQA